MKTRDEIELMLDKFTDEVTDDSYIAEGIQKGLLWVLGTIGDEVLRMYTEE